MVMMRFIPFFSSGKHTLVSNGSEAMWLAERIVWGSGGLDIVRLE